LAGNSQGAVSWEVEKCHPSFALAAARVEGGGSPGRLFFEKSARKDYFSQSAAFEC
jgi:hypothetical protein